VRHKDAKHCDHQYDQTYCCHVLTPLLKQTGPNDPIASDPMP